ncbi:MAG: FAD:protein FMN transferase [Gemmatimonadota bacterium]|nr:MAG: FAD:protein FMN transferase [Gemmatimonadota bacterium]
MTHTPKVAPRFAALAELGFECVRGPHTSVEIIPIDDAVSKAIATRPAMGTLVSLTLLTSARARAEEAIGRAFEEMDRLIAIFSHYDPASAVSQLNSAGTLDRPPRELAHVVSRSLQFNRLSDGAFDISVAPVVELFKGRPPGSLPSKSEVREALELVGVQHVAASRKRLSFERSGMCLTFDGVAKGYIVDAMARVLKRHRIKNYLIEAGGDIRASGTKERRLPWAVAVQDPERSGLFPDTIHLANGAVATSGSYERHFDPDQEHHHIIDSHLGVSPQFSVSASVIAPNAMVADALATTVFLMLPEAGVKFVEGLRGCECLVVGRDGMQVRSGGWPSAGPTRKRKAEA